MKINDCRKFYKINKNNYRKLLSDDIREYTEIKSIEDNKFGLYEGITIVCFLNSEFNKYYDEVKKYLSDKEYKILPLDTLHFTLLNLYCRSHYKLCDYNNIIRNNYESFNNMCNYLVTQYPLFYSLIRNIDTDYLENYIDSNKSNMIFKGQKCETIKLQIKDIYVGHTIKIILKAEVHINDKLTQEKQKLKSSLLNETLIDTKYYHITLAYNTNIVKDNNLDEIKKNLEIIFDRLESLDFLPPCLCYFNSMSSFYPLYFTL